MKNAIVKIAAALSAAVLCAAPMTANAAAFNKDLAAKMHLGDVNGDGIIDGRDASIVYSWVEKNGRNVTEYCDMARVTGEYAITDEDAYVIHKVYAQSSANKNLMGDANNDGQVDISDAVHVECAISNPNKYTINNRIYADVNRDNIVNSIDSKLIQRYLAKCFTTFEINFGDVNDDGKLDAEDCRNVLGYSGQTWNKKTISADLFTRCDANGDGKINSNDFVVIYYASKGKGFTY